MTASASAGFAAAFLPQRKPGTFFEPAEFPVAG
jgi:hypothetical protein